MSFQEHTAGSWSAQVHFPDGSQLPEIQGTSHAEACHLARQQIHEWMLLQDLLRQKLPEMAQCRPNCQLVAPQMSYMWAMQLRYMRRSRGWTQQEAAANLGLSQSTYCVLEDPQRCNPTLKTMEKIYDKWDVFVSLRPYPRGEFSEVPQWPRAPLRRRKKPPAAGSVSGFEQSFV